MGLAQQGQPNPLPLPPAQATTYPLSGSGPILGFANRFVRGHGSICCLACCLEASMLRCRTSLPLETDCKHVVNFGQRWRGVTCTNLAGPCCIIQKSHSFNPRSEDFQFFPGHGDVKTHPPEHEDFDMFFSCFALCLSIPFSISPRLWLGSDERRPHNTFVLQNWIQSSSALKGSSPSRP